MNIHMAISITIGLFAILNPFAVLPYYLLSNPKNDFRLAKKDALIMSFSALLILTIGWFLWLQLLGFFGLEMRYFKIAWGCIIAYNAFRMVTWLMPAWHKETWEKMNDVDRRWLIVPLTMPLVAWPWSLAYVISRFGTDSELWLMLSIAIFICCCLYYLIIRYSFYLQKLLWSLWIALIGRFMGLLLLGIWIQAILSNL